MEKGAAAEEKAKPQKRTKFSEDVSVELQVNDILNPSLEAIASSNKKYVALSFLLTF